MMSTYSRPARRYNRMLRKFCPKNPKPSRKRKMVMSASTTMAMSALLPKKALMKSSARQRRTAIGATIGGAATTSAILQSWRLGNGCGKCRSVTIRLQNSAVRCPLSCGRQTACPKYRTSIEWWAMALTNAEIVRYSDLIEKLIWAKRRPPLHLREKVREGQRIAGHEIELFLVRPLFFEPTRKVESSIAKTRYVGTR